MTIPAGRQTAPSATFALDYTRRGWPVVPVPLREKGPRILDWQKLRITPEMVPSYFTEPSNIGVILGDGLVDVDLDCIEALAISDEVLPQTGSVFGRATTPRAHRLYYVDGPAPTLKLSDPLTGDMMIELRGDKRDGSAGLQTIVPPSIHRESGEQIEWVEDGDPARVDYATLKRAVLAIAERALITRYCPGAGNGAPHAFAGADPRIRLQIERWQAEAKAARPSSSAQVEHSNEARGGEPHGQAPSMTAPAWDTAQHRALKAAVVQRIAQGVASKPRALTLSEDDVSWVWTMLTFVDSSSYDMWFKIGAALHDIAAWPAELRFKMWCRWSSEFDRSEPKKIDLTIKQSDQWLSYGRPYNGERATIGTLHHYAMQSGWDEQVSKPLPDEFRRLLPAPASTSATATDTISGAAQAAPAPDAEIDAKIKWLAGLAPVQYERLRKKEADGLGWRVSVLDKLVNAERGDGKADERQGHALTLFEPEPWPHVVNGQALVGDLTRAVRRYVVMAEEFAFTTALWIVHTYVFDIFMCTPRLCISSPEKRCGKTTLLDVIGYLVNRPLLTANITGPAIFRTVEKARPTILFDEADNMFHRHGKAADSVGDILSILNSGHRHGGQVTRTVGDDFEPRMFSTHAPAAIALIGNLPATLADRSIGCTLDRKHVGDRVDQFRIGRTEDLHCLARQARRWCEDARSILAGSDPVMPEGVLDRAADNWRPLFAIADAADCSSVVRAAAVRAAVRTAAQEVDEAPGVMLLADIKAVFAEQKTDRLSSERLATLLSEREGRPWADCKRGDPMDKHGLARRLKLFGIQPEPEAIHFSDRSRARGYLLSAFGDAFARYLPV